MDYDPTSSGRLPDSFSGAGCDIVILSHAAGEGDGMSWLRQFMAVRHFPPVLYIGTGNEREIVEAIKTGAEEYLSEGALNHRTITTLLNCLAEQIDPPSGAYPVLADGRAELPPGIKGYEVQRLLSSGAMSTIYLTRETATGRNVALKVLHQVPDAGGGNVIFDRFLQEFELIGQIHHPNVVDIYDLGVADDHAYIAMEYCSRGSLKRRIRQGMRPERAEAIMRAIAEALGAIHAVGILHRDLKPTNVLFREDGSVALIDFGLAKAVHFEGEMTGSGEIFGTPYYMSPEQGHADAVDESSDIYSLGVMFYEMLTGKKPFEGGTAMALIVKHGKAPRPQLPEDLQRYQPLLERMMARLPQERFRSVPELLEFLAYLEAN